MEPERRRPPRPKRQPDVVRASIEIGAFGAFAVVVLTILGVVLHAGSGESAPPPNTVIVSQGVDFATLSG